MVAAIALIPVPSARAEISFDRLRRDSSVRPDEDLATMVGVPVAAAAPVTMAEFDPYFSKIIGQILSEAGLLGKGSLSENLQETLEG